LYEKDYRKNKQTPDKEQTGYAITVRKKYFVLCFLPSFLIEIATLMTAKIFSDIETA
jgi:hypothetical protein